ncbi:MAG: hypothetical protein LBS52_08195 [Dysgonamonadaceae bacterium]|jgi:hypothetical protein|nr:hypothetical protein [Dysgonamonadaceae bacterium]
MKKILLTLGAALLMTGLMAQNNGGNYRPERMSVKDRVDRMAKSLELTDQQKKDLTTFYTEMDEQMKKERESGTQRSREEMGTRTKEMNDKVKAIIGNEKFEKWQSTRPQRDTNAPDREGAGNRPNARASQGQGTPPASVSPEEQAEWLTKRLDLTPTQKAALVKHFTEAKAKRESAGKDVQKSDADRRAELQKARDAENAEIAKIIGKEKMEQLKNQRRNSTERK